MPEPSPAVVDVTRYTDRPFEVDAEADGMFHTYSATADALTGLGPDARIDMGDGAPLQDVLVKVAMDTGFRRIPAAEAPTRYRAIAARLPVGSRAHRVVSQLADRVDGPPLEPMQLPEDVNPAVRDLVRTVEALPAFRNEDNDQAYRAYQRVQDIARRAAAGEQRRALLQDIGRLHNSVHELNFDLGSEQFNRAIFVASEALQRQRRPAS